MIYKDCCHAGIWKNEGDFEINAASEMLKIL